MRSIVMKRCGRFRSKSVVSCSSGCEIVLRRSFSKNLSFSLNYSRNFSTAFVDVPKAYEPSVVESKIIEKWRKRQGNSLLGEEAPIFRMVLPPPNVTGKLHLGHSLTLAIEDTLARWKVMNGYKLEWTPGFDHAGIATHSVATRKFSKSSSGIDFDTEVKMLAKENLEAIKLQLESMGTLLDWNSAYYTLDEDHSLIVKEAFVHLFDSGLIKRGDGLVNWSCALGSSVADVEVDHIDFKGRTTFRFPGYDMPVECGVLYFCKYTIINSDETIVVATSRPETMFGDVALAVNPRDARYAALIGKNVINPLNENVMPIIGDSRVKTDFGTGVVKITPSHDKLDFAIGQSHGLKKVNILTSSGLLNENCLELQGVGRFRARKLVLEKLDAVGLLETSKEYAGSVGLCNRTGDFIEPRIFPHWFLQTQLLTEKFLATIKNGELVIVPEHHCHSLVSMLENCQDWCLSRQIKWGHATPAYFHKMNPEKWVSALDLEEAKDKLQRKLGVEIENIGDIVQDPDVLDTWFSSAMIPLNISGWPESQEVKELSLMETGNDILLFWVWRMAIVTLALVDKLPFRNVLLHGIVTDHYNRKMSKSRGNVIDPIHVINGRSSQDLANDAKSSFESGELTENEYRLRVAALKKDYPEGFKACGTDALRFSLLSQDILSQEIKLDLSYLENCRHFTNKIWQALRFYLMHSDKNNFHQDKIQKPVKKELLSLADHWLLACLDEFIIDANMHLDKGQFHLYAESVRKFFYQQLCDVYIEMVKKDLHTGNLIEQHLSTLSYALASGLKVSHPLMPFVTEEIWSHLTSEKDGLLIDQRSLSTVELAEFKNPFLIEFMLKSMRIVREVRSLKVRMGYKAKEAVEVFLEVPEEYVADFQLTWKLMETLSGSNIRLHPPPQLDRSNFISVIFNIDDQQFRFFVPKGDKTIEDVAAERIKVLKLQKKLEKLLEQINLSEKRDTHPVVKEKLRKKVDALKDQINKYNLNEQETKSPTNSSPSPV